MLKVVKRETREKNARKFDAERSFHRIKDSVQCNVGGFLAAFDELPKMLQHLMTQNGELSNEISELKQEKLEKAAMYTALETVVNQLAVKVAELERRDANWIKP